MNDHLLNKIKQTIYKLHSIPAVVGYETPLINFLEELAINHGYLTARVDGMLVVNPNSESGVLFSAHADRHGLVTLEDGTCGYAAFSVEKDKYEINYDKLPAILARVEENYAGKQAVAYDPDSGLTLEQGVIKSCERCETLETIKFQVEGFGSLPVGTPVSIATYYEDDGVSISCQIDNVMSVALLAMLMEEGVDAIFCFTPEEEIGQSRVPLHTFLSTKEQLPDVYVADTSPFETTDFMQEGTIILRNKDTNSHFSSELNEQLTQHTEHLGMPYLYVDSWIEEQNALTGESQGIGLTELGHLLSHLPEVNGTTLQISTIHYHTNHEKTTRLSVKNLYNLMQSIVKNTHSFR